MIKSCTIPKSTINNLNQICDNNCNVPQLSLSLNYVGGGCSLLLLFAVCLWTKIVLHSTYWFCLKLIWEGPGILISFWSYEIVNCLPNTLFSAHKLQQFYTSKFYQKIHQSASDMNWKCTSEIRVKNWKRRRDINKENGLAMLRESKK